MPTKKTASAPAASDEQGANPTEPTTTLIETQTTVEDFSDAEASADDAPVDPERTEVEEINGTTIETYF